MQIGVVSHELFSEYVTRSGSVHFHHKLYWRERGAHVTSVSLALQIVGRAFDVKERRFIIPAEGVHAVFEAKQTLVANLVNYVQKKISSDGAAFTATACPCHAPKVTIFPSRSLFL